MADRAVTVSQPHADLLVGGNADVANLNWPVPANVAQWWRCNKAPGGVRREPDLVAATGSGDCDVPDGPFPFDLWIHAAAKERPVTYRAYAEWADHTPWGRAKDHLRLGVIVGRVTVVGCHPADGCKHGRNPDRWTIGDEFDGVRPRWCSSAAAPDGYHWQVTGGRPLVAPVAAKGRPRLWQVDDDVAARLAEVPLVEVQAVETR